MTFYKKNIVFRLIAFTVFTGILIPFLVQDGMFVDGVTYAAISKNLANGIGSCWAPAYTKTLYPVFYEHPPLAMIIESFFFKVLGNGLYTERIYTLLTAVLTALGISMIWNLLSQDDHQKKMSWMPVLLWITVPVIAWSYKNNLLENTVGIFTIFSVFFILKSLKRHRIVYLFAGGLFIVFAFLSKGFVALFPFIVPLIYAIVFKSGKKGNVLIYSVLLVMSSIAAFYFFMLLFPDLKVNLKHYFAQQLMPTLNNAREVTTDNRFFILLELVVNISIPLLLFIYLSVRRWIKERETGFAANHNFMFLLLLAFSASAPLVISPKQRRFYLDPSIPFYVLSVSFYIGPFMRSLLERISDKVVKWLRILTYMALSSIIIFSIVRFGTYLRDKGMLEDIYAIARVVPEGTIVGTTRKLYSDWSFVAYMNRIGYLSLDDNHKHNYFLMENSSRLIPEGYKKTDISLKNYVLCERK